VHGTGDTTMLGIRVPGTGSVITTPVAPCGPLFITVIMYVRVAPGATLLGAVFVMATSAPVAPATVIVPEVPVIVAVTVSVAVTICAPAVFNVTENVPTPFVSVEFAGKVAAASLLVMCTVPVYPVAVVFPAVNAVTVTFTGVPDVAVAGAVTEKCVAVAAAANVAATAIGGVAAVTVKLHVVAVGFAQTLPVHPENVAFAAGVSVNVTGDPSANPDVHVPVCVPPAVFVQLIAFDASFTFPGPVTVTFTVPPPDVKPTSAVVAADIPTAQLTALLDKQFGVVPVHPKKVEPPPAVTESVTRVPAPKFVMHVPLVTVPASMQLIPVGVLVTVPPPV